jgi:hypothetical protein
MYAAINLLVVFHGKHTWWATKVAEQVDRLLHHNVSDLSLHAKLKKLHGILNGMNATRYVQLLF